MLVRKESKYQTGESYDKWDRGKIAVPEAEGKEDSSQETQLRVDDARSRGALNNYADLPFFSPPCLLLVPSIGPNHLEAEGKGSA